MHGWELRSSCPSSVSASNNSRRFPGLEPGPQGVRQNENVGRYPPPVDGTGDGRQSRRRIVGDVSARRTSNSDRCQEQQHRWDSAPYDYPYAGSAPIWLPRRDPYRGHPGPRPLHRPQPSGQGFRPRVSHVVPCSSSRRVLRRSGRDQERGVRDFRSTRARRHADLRVPVRSDLSGLDAVPRTFQRPEPAGQARDPTPAEGAAAATTACRVAHPQ